jgi:ArsR family transcriptional regulator, lead/cadmium/zinc/bismuth-responsive transcriptional repressor
MASDHTHRSSIESSIDDSGLVETARLLAALGDPERLRLLDLMSGGEVCVGELAEATGAAMTTVSQRLKVLRERGLVTVRRDGKHMYYRLADGHVGDLVRIGLAHALEIEGGRTNT